MPEPYVYMCWDLMYAHTCLTQILLLFQKFYFWSHRFLLSARDTGFQPQTPRWYPLFLAYFLLLSNWNVSNPCILPSGLFEAMDLLISAKLILAKYTGLYIVISSLIPTLPEIPINVLTWLRGFLLLSHTCISFLWHISLKCVDHI